MAINYTTLFTRLGQVVKQGNLWFTYQNTLLTAGSALLDQYEVRRDLVTGVQEQFQSESAQIRGWVSQLKTTADKTLSDLQAALDAPSSDVATILKLLPAQMVLDSATI